MRGPSGLIETMKSIHTCLFSLVLAFAFGCEEPKEPPSKTEAPASKAAEKAPEAPTPPPEPTPPPAPKVWPKFAECKGKTFELSSPELEGAIRVKAQKPEGEITVQDLKKLRSLNLSRVPADKFDVCVLQHTRALKELAIGADQIGDLDAVVGMTSLESLSVGKSDISDLTPLAKMTRLDRLTITDSKVSDLSPLKSLKALTEINLDNNPVSDVSVLSGMKKLEKISLAKTQVASADAFRDLKELKVLYVKGSPLGDDIAATGYLVRNGTKVIRD
jgi:Leucine-rich repeat (LRR) protein